MNKPKLLICGANGFIGKNLIVHLNELAINVQTFTRENPTQDLPDLIKKSADKTGDRVWQLPLYDDYFLELKTNFADIRNIGGRYGGAITAAAFLAKFTEDIKWAHLDIAGVAMVDREHDLSPKGATGFGVRLLNSFVKTNFETNCM